MLFNATETAVNKDWSLLIAAYAEGTAAVTK